MISVSQNGGYTNRLQLNRNGYIILIFSLALLEQSIFSISFVLSFFLGFGFEVVDVVPVFAVPILAVVAMAGLGVFFSKVVSVPHASPMFFGALPFRAVPS